MTGVCLESLPHKVGLVKVSLETFSQTLASSHQHIMGIFNLYFPQQEGGIILTFYLELFLETRSVYIA